MSDQFSLGLLAKMLELLTERVTVLEDQMAALLEDEEEGEPNRYMDGTLIE